MTLLAAMASLERGGGSVASLLRLIAFVAPQARRRAPERTFWGKSSKADRDSRCTPPDFMANIYDAFGAIDLDPCAHLDSPVVARRRILVSEGGDGLVDAWSGQLAFVNPPFSELLVWLRRAHDRATGGTGLGLPIARSLIAGSGGELHLAQAAVGTAFVISLPNAVGGQPQHRPGKNRESG